MLDNAFLKITVSWVVGLAWLSALCLTAHLRHTVISQNCTACCVLLLIETIQISFPSISFVN